MYAVTRGLARAGDVAVVVPDGAPVAALRLGADGRGYSPYGVLPSLLAVPLFALGALLGAGAGAPPAAFDYATRFAVSALNAPITAATAALLAGWALRLGAGKRSAAGLAVLYGFCTFAWPYSRTFFSEPLAALLLLLAAERAHAALWFCSPSTSAETGTRRAWCSVPALLVSGLAAGLLVATRVASAVALPVLLLYLLLAQAAMGRNERLSLRERLWILACWGSGLLPGLGIVAWYNLVRFGTPLATGYAAEATLFTTPLLVGLHGLLLSPGKSLFLYAPPLLLALPGAWRHWQRRRGLVLLVLGLFLAHLLLYATWGEWQGGGVWGPRFLLPVVPLLLLLATPTQHEGRGSARMQRDRRSQALRFLPGALFGILGFVGNLGGVWLNFNTYLNAPLAVDRIYSWADTPLLAHWRIIAERVGRYTTPAPACALGDGFFALEADPTLPQNPDARLPRRSGAHGTLRCRMDRPARLLLRIDDRRPPNAPPSDLALTIDGQRFAQAAGEARAYRLLLPPGRTQLTISATTWNPRQIGFSDRDDALGVLVSAATLEQDDCAVELGTDARFASRQPPGCTLQFVDTAIAPLPERPRPRWAWYYDPPNIHLVDHWAWYLPRSELAGGPAWVVTVVLLVVALSCLGAGAVQITRRPPRDAHHT